MIDIGIDQHYPILLGSTLRHMMENKFKIEKRVFMKFVTYLEQSKGYNVDAQKFRDYWEEHEAKYIPEEMKPS